jgi:hypothetical protein
MKKKIDIKKSKTKMIGVRVSEKLHHQLETLAKKNDVPAISTIAEYILSNEIHNYE